MFNPKPSRRSAFGCLFAFPAAAFAQSRMEDVPAAAGGFGPGRATDGNSLPALLTTHSVLDFIPKNFHGGIVNSTNASDLSSYVQAAIDSVTGLGGILIFPPGQYLLGTQVTIDRTFGSLGAGHHAGERSLRISGYGAELRTTGAISAFHVTGGWTPHQACLIEGFTIDHRSNAHATGGISAAAAAFVTIRDVVVLVSDDLPDGYGAFTFSNSDPANADKGCFWALVDHCNVRPLDGTEGSCNYGVKALGTTNAITVRNCSFGGSKTHIYLGPHVGQTLGPNSAHIENNFFEGPASAVCVHLVSNDATYHIPGVRIISNRFEAINTVLKLTGRPKDVQTPVFLAGNYGDAAIPTYLDNMRNVPVNTIDAALVGLPIGPTRHINREGAIFENTDSAYHAVVARAANVGKGFALETGAGTLLGSWVYGNSSGSQLQGVWATGDFLRLGVVGGISGTGVDAKNLAGRKTLTSGSGAVAFPHFKELDADYRILLTGNANETFWVTGKAIGGFTIHSSNASSNATVDWFLCRGYAT